MSTTKAEPAVGRTGFSPRFWPISRCCGHRRDRLKDHKYTARRSCTRCDPRWAPSTRLCDGAPSIEFSVLPVDAMQREQVKCCNLLQYAQNPPPIDPNDARGRFFAGAPDLAGAALLAGATLAPPGGVDAGAAFGEAATAAPAAAPAGGAALTSSSSSTSPKSNALKPRGAACCCSGRPAVTACACMLRDTEAGLCLFWPAAWPCCVCTCAACIVPRNCRDTQRSNGQNTGSVLWINTEGLAAQRVHEAPSQKQKPARSTGN